ncbi:MAG: hypothetical protein AAFO79_12160 [Pseudomonadota bacterium]
MTDAKPDTDRSAQEQVRYLAPVDQDGRSGATYTSMVQNASLLPWEAYVTSDAFLENRIRLMALEPDAYREAVFDLLHEIFETALSREPKDPVVEAAVRHACETIKRGSE